MQSGYFDFYVTSILRLKISLCEAQNWRCCYCKLPVELYKGEPTEQNTATFEHVIPLTLGGRDTPDNMVIACYLCNKTRRASSSERFSTLVEKLLQHNEIRAFWHKFSRRQISLFELEVDYDVILERHNKAVTSQVSFLKRSFESS